MLITLSAPLRRLQNPSDEVVSFGLVPQGFWSKKIGDATPKICSIFPRSEVFRLFSLFVSSKHTRMPVEWRRRSQRPSKRRPLSTLVSSYWSLLCVSLDAFNRLSFNNVSTLFFSVCISTYNNGVYSRYFVSSFYNWALCYVVLCTGGMEPWPRPFDNWISGEWGQHQCCRLRRRLRLVFTFSLFPAAKRALLLFFFLPPPQIISSST